jgi:hypothetical protein
VINDEVIDNMDKEIEEPEDLPPSEKPRMAEDAVAFAQRAIDSNDQDENMLPPPSDINE